MCDEPGPTREHVPPRCCFPKTDPSSEESLFRGNNRQGQLITVPSCELHNTGRSQDRTSQDAELILFTTACSESANSMGHAVARYRMAVTRDRNDLFMRWLSHVSDTIIHTQADGSLRRSGTFIVPIKRYLRALDRVGLGLYYHIHKDRFRGAVRSFPRELYSKSEIDCKDHVLLRRQVIARARETVGRGLPFEGPWRNCLAGTVVRPRPVS